MQEKTMKKIDRRTTKGQVTEEEAAGADMGEVKQEVMMRENIAREEEEVTDQEEEVTSEEEEANEVPARRILLPLLWRSLWLGQEANHPNH